jgi:hypothetical protein
VSFFLRQFQRLPESSRSIFLTGIYGLAGGLAAVVFELGISWIYLWTFVALSHRTLTVFLTGTPAVIVFCSLGGGWLMGRENRAPVLEQAATFRRNLTINEVARLLIEAPGGFAVLEAGDKPAGILTLHDLLPAEATLAARSTH